MRISWRLLMGIAIVMGGACTVDDSASITTSTAPITTTTTTTLPSDAATAAYVDCLAEHGVEVDAIRLDANGRPQLDLVNSQLDYSDQATVEAMTACAGLLSDGALDLADDEALREGVMEQLTAFSRCLRARGVSGFPDPIPGFIGIGSPYPAAEIPYNDPELPAAAKACQETVFGTYPGSGG